MRRRCFDLTVWIHTPEWPIPRGFTRGDDENRHTLRIGPLCIAWQIERDVEAESRG